MAEISTMSYISPDRHETIIFNDGDGFFIEEGGLSGFSGDSEDVALALPSGGQQLISINIKPMSGKLKVYVTGDDYPGQAQERIQKITRMFSRLEHGLFTLNSHDGILWTLPLRQAGAIEVPDVETAYDDTIRREIPVVSDRGYWSSTTHAAFKNTDSGKMFSFTNDSEIPTSAIISWKNIPGESAPTVTIEGIGPFQLPKPTGDEEEKFLLDLSPRASMAVFDKNKNLRMDMWRSLKLLFLATEVLPGQTQKITVSGGDADVSYEIKTLNPWRW